MNPKARIVPLGDSALLVQFGDEIDPAINQRVHMLDAFFRINPPEGIIDTVPANATLLVIYDPLALDYEQALYWVNAQMEQIKSVTAYKPRRIEVPVRYGGEDGPDLDFVASYHHININEVVRIHTGREYTVYMMGFTPGFPYMGKLDDAIVTPRLETPRTHVPRGTVAIAGAQTGIYPLDSPGGWRLIGRTSLQLFNPDADPPILFSPGDVVKFIVEAVNA